MNGIQRRSHLKGPVSSRLEMPPRHVQLCSGRGGLLACLKDTRSINSIGVIGTGCVGCVLVVGEEFKSGR